MFLDKVLKSKPQDDQGSQSVIVHDAWDFDDWNRISEELKELSIADDKLSKFTDTGHEAMEDSFFSLFKAAPVLEDKKAVRPSYLVNHRVLGEAMDLKEYRDLRTYSTLDIVATGMACVTMEPELEILFEKLEEEQEMARKIEQMLQQMAGLKAESKTIEEMIEEALAEGDEEGAAQAQKEAEANTQAQQQLEQEIEDSTNQLEESLDSKTPEIQKALGSALNTAKDEAERVDNVSNYWGLDPSAIKKMDATKRIELAKRIDNPRFRKIAALLGPMRRLALAEQSRKLEIAKDEIYDIELGNELMHTLAEEFLFLTDDEIEDLWFQKFYEAELIQFKLRGTEKVAKGDIIFCEDGSGSMAGTPEIWTKAVGLALLSIARSQNRGFEAIHFASPGFWKHFYFDWKNKRSSTIDFTDATTNVDELDGVMDYAETFMSGGTCFMTPLGRAVNELIDQYNKDGKLKGDIVFCTDGQAEITPEFLEVLKEVKEKTGLRIFGIQIGHEPKKEPMHTICDGKVFTIKDLLTGTDIKDIFRSL